MLNCGVFSLPQNTSVFRNQNDIEITYDYLVNASTLTDKKINLFAMKIQAALVCISKNDSNETTNLIFTTFCSQNRNSLVVTL